MSRVGVGDGLRPGPVGASRLGDGCRHVVELFADESQFVPAVGDVGLPLGADVTFPPWKKS